MINFQIYDDANILPDSWDQIVSAVDDARAFFMQKKILMQLQKLNPCQQRYYIDEKNTILAVSYALKLDLLTFKKKHNLNKQVRIIGLPLSVAVSGIYCAEQMYQTVIRELSKENSGLLIALNKQIINNQDKTLATLPTYRLNITWSSFTEYVSAMRSNYRRNVYNSWGKAANLEVNKLRDCADFSLEMYDWYVKAFQKSSNKLEMLPLSFFREFPAEIFVFYNNAKPLAFVQLLEHQRQLYFLFGGYDGKYNQSYALYQNMLIFIVRLAIKRRAEFIDFGQTADQSKMRLGAEQIGMQMSIAHNSPVLNYCYQHIAEFFQHKSYQKPHQVFPQKFIQLYKCHSKTILNLINPIVTEPLELEYLAATINKVNKRLNAYKYRISDDILDKNLEKSLSELEEKTLQGKQITEIDILVLSGYVTAVPKIIEIAVRAKKINPNIVVVVGGVHAELNPQTFYNKFIDFVIFSNGVNAFAELLKTNFCKNIAINIKGIAVRSKKNEWHTTERVTTDMERIPLPDRSYLYNNCQKTHYMKYRPLAIIKTALSCPYECSFCYCRLLNESTFAERKLSDVFQEIHEIANNMAINSLSANINNVTIWIVDDCFLLSKERIYQFIQGVGMIHSKIKEKHNVNLQFIAYARADFIADNSEIIRELATVGFVELIVGLEAITDEELTVMNKQVDALQNVKAINVTKAAGLRLTGLFIVSPTYTRADFRKLDKWLLGNKLDSYTISIMTPILANHSTVIVDEAEASIVPSNIKLDYSKYDFLHLHSTPSNMSRVEFYARFYLLYFKLFMRSKYVRHSTISIIWRKIWNR